MAGLCCASLLAENGCNRGVAVCGSVFVLAWPAWLCNLKHAAMSSAGNAMRSKHGYKCNLWLSSCCNGQWRSWQLQWPVARVKCIHGSASKSQSTRRNISLSARKPAKAAQCAERPAFSFCISWRLAARKLSCTPLCRCFKSKRRLAAMRGSARRTFKKHRNGCGSLGAAIWRHGVWLAESHAAALILLSWRKRGAWRVRGAGVAAVAERSNAEAIVTMSHYIANTSTETI